MESSPLVGRDSVVAEVVAACRNGPGIAVIGAPGSGTTAVLHAAAAALRAESVPVHDLAGGDVAESLRAVEGSGGVMVVDDLDVAPAFGPREVAEVHRLVLSGRSALLATLGSDAEQGWWADLVPRSLLPPLERVDADALAEATLGGPLDARSRERLWVFARGHPRALITAIELVAAEGGWDSSSGLWTLRGDLDVAVEPEVREVVSGLPGDVRTTMEVLAVAGSLPLDAAEALPGGSAVLTDAERRGLVRVETRSEQVLWCAPQSEMLAAALRGQLAKGAEAEHWRLIAEVLRGGHGAAVAVLRAQSVLGEADERPVTDHERQVLVDGAEAAFTLSRWGLGAELAARAWASGGGLEALQVLAQCLGARGDHEAIRTLSEELASRSAAAEEIRTHAQSIAVSQFHLGDADGAFATLDRARDGAAGREAAALALVESHLRSFAGHRERAAELARPWVDSDDIEVRVEALTALGTDAVNRGRWAEAEQRYGEALTAALALDDPDLAASLAGTPFLFRLAARAEAGELASAISQAEAVEARLVGRDDPTAHGWLTLHLARSHLRAGNAHSAARWAGESANDLRRVHRPGWLAHPVALQVAAHALAGERDAAREALRVWSALPAHAVAVFRGEELRLVAALSALEGDRDGSARLVDDAVTAARAAGSLPYLAAALHDQVRLGDPAGRRAAAAELGRLVVASDGPLVAAFAARARSSVDGDLVGLADAARTLEELGALLDAAECWAEVARGASDDRAAADARRRGAMVRDRAEPFVSPLLDGDERPLLTGRESEIVDMVVEGLTRQEIAQRLVVSVRTVDSHLQRVYRKLGVRGRRGLVAAIGAPTDGVAGAP